MRKIFLTCVVLASCYHVAAIADDSKTWKGELYGIMPRHKDVTVEYCKSHALDTFQTTAEQADKDVTGDNGVKAKNMGYKRNAMGGIYVEVGTTMFSGIINGKPWQEKVHYFGQTLVEKDGMEQGAWYTKDCKGFFKLGPV